MTQVEKDKEEKICDISDVLETYGKYQFFQYVLICLPSMVISMISVNYVFTVGDVNYRCHIDGCENENSTVQFPPWWPDRNIDRCSTPLLKTGQEICTNNSFTGELADCNHWIYESNNTVVAELNLACQPWKTNLVGTVHNMGMLVSMVVSGWMSDNFGRKPTFIFCIVGGSIGHIKTFATSYYVYIVLEFIEALITAGCYSAAMVLLLEITGKKYRVLAGVIFAYGIYAGECLLVCIAMLVPYWKTLIRIINGPSLFFIILIFFVNESPRWQIVRGKVQNAKKILKNIAKHNNISINNEELESIDDRTLIEKFDIRHHEVKESLLTAFKSIEIMKRLLVACMARFTTNFVYYGMMLNSVWLPGDKHINFLLSTLMSFPGEILVFFFMSKVGRKIPLQVGFILCGILCIISASTPAQYVWVKLSLFLAAKIIIAGCFTGAITYAIELFPTSVRGSLLGMASFTSQIGGMMAPLTPILNNVSEVIPSTLFGCSAIITGLLFFLTPETKDSPLHDTINQVVNYSKNKHTVNKGVDIAGTSLEDVTDKT